MRWETGNKNNTWPVQGKKRTVAFTAPGVRALVVDDIEINLQVAMGFLSLYGIKADTCTSGDEALEQIKKTNYDLILMDYMMPGMDGIETTEQIRSMGKTNDWCRIVPVIAVTANAVPGAKEMFLEHGFSDYLPKPLSFSGFSTLMAKWIPPEKQIQTEENNEDADFELTEKQLEKAVQKKTVRAIQINGIDTEQGLINCNGSIEAYREVLESFLEDTDEKFDDIELIKIHIADHMDKTMPHSFGFTAHAIKGISAIIGAQTLSKKAAALETAAKTNDTKNVQKVFPDFYQEFEIITKNVKSYVELYHV